MIRRLLVVTLVVVAVAWLDASVGEDRPFRAPKVTAPPTTPTSMGPVAPGTITRFPLGADPGGLVVGDDAAYVVLASPDGARELWRIDGRSGEMMKVSLPGQAIGIA